jgi:hypothetical protein
VAPVSTKHEIAKIAGVSHDTVAKRRLADEYDAAQQSRLIFNWHVTSPRKPLEK